MAFSKERSVLVFLLGIILGFLYWLNVSLTHVIFQLTMVNHQALLKAILQVPYQLDSLLSKVIHSLLSKACLSKVKTFQNWDVQLLSSLIILMYFQSLFLICTEWAIVRPIYQLKIHQSLTIFRNGLVTFLLM